MKNKGKKALIVLMCLLTMCSGVLFAPPQETYARTSDQETIMPMADVYIWKYKVINNKMYKRLFNSSKKKWVGDWIRC